MENGYSQSAGAYKPGNNFTYCQPGSMGNGSTLKEKYLEAKTLVLTLSSDSEDSDSESKGSRLTVINNSDCRGSNANSNNLNGKESSSENKTEPFSSPYNLNYDSQQEKSERVSKLDEESNLRLQESFPEENRPIKVSSSFEIIDSKSESYNEKDDKSDQILQLKRTIIELKALREESMKEKNSPFCQVSEARSLRPDLENTEVKVEKKKKWEVRNSTNDVADIYLMNATVNGSCSKIDLLVEAKSPELMETNGRSSESESEPLDEEVFYSDSQKKKIAKLRKSIEKIMAHPKKSRQGRNEKDKTKKKKDKKNKKNESKEPIEDADGDNHMKTYDPPKRPEVLSNKMKRLNNKPGIKTAQSRLSKLKNKRKKCRFKLLDAKNHIKKAYVKPLKISKDLTRLDRALLHFEYEFKALETDPDPELSILFLRQFAAAILKDYAKLKKQYGEEEVIDELVGNPVVEISRDLIFEMLETCRTIQDNDFKFKSNESNKT